MEAPGLTDGERLPWVVRVLTQAGAVKGAGFLVDDRHVVTCAHVATAVLPAAGTVGRAAPRGTVRLDFLEDVQHQPVNARVLVGGWFPVEPNECGDVAVLELLSPLPSCAAPAPLGRPRSLRGHEVEVYGFPRLHDMGIPAAGHLAGWTGPDREWVQIEALRPFGYKVQRGFSGAAVWDTQARAVVGMVVADDKIASTGVSWMIPMHVLARRWRPLDAEVRSWQMYWADELSAHWGPRARGVERDSIPGWYFSGREKVLATLVKWLAAPADGRVCVVAGEPGAGKSAVLSRLVTLADPRYRRRMPVAAMGDPNETPPLGSIDVAIHARHKDLQGVIAAAARAAELELHPANDDEADRVIEALLEKRRPFCVVVDALDEATQAEAIARDFLRPLARDGAREGVRVLVGTRSAGIDLINALGASPETVIDVGLPPYLERADLVSYVRRRLLQSDDPAGQTPYRGRYDLANQVASAVVERAYPSFLIAQLVSRGLSQNNATVDISRGELESHLANEVCPAFEGYLRQRFKDRRDDVRDLLRPVAFAEGVGLPFELWPSLATALAGKTYDSDAVRELLHGPAADYLLEQVEALGRRCHRFSHEALAECLRASDTTETQRRFAMALISSVPQGQDGAPDWLRADPYVRAYLATHAAKGAVLDELLEDPGFLVAANPSSLLAALGTATTLQGREAARVYQRGGHSLRRAAELERPSYVEMIARQSGAEYLAERIAARFPQRPWSVPWARWQHIHAHQLIGRHDGPVRAVAFARVDGRLMVVSGGEDRVIRRWDPLAGEAIGIPLEGHEHFITSLVVANLDGRAAVISCGYDGRLRRWDLTTGRPIGTPHYIAQSAESLANGILDNHCVGVICGTDYSAQRWNFTAGIPLGEDIGGPPDTWVRRVAMWVHRGRAVVVAAAWSTRADPAVHCWDFATGRRVGRPHTGHRGTIRDLVVGELNGRPVAISCGDDGTVRRWDVIKGSPIGDPLTGHDGIVWAVAYGRFGDRAAAVSAGEDATVRCWDLASGEPIGVPLIGHEGWVRAVALSEVNGHPVVVSGGDDGTLRYWEIDSAEPPATLNSDA